MAQAVTLETDLGFATLRLARAHGNAINGDLVRDLTRVVREAAADDRIHAATLAASGKLFCPGLDLVELIALDRGAMADFLGRFNACVLALYTFPKPLVAAIHGPAVAGGLVLALTADWRVLRAGAVVGLNEVKVGLPFPFGVAMILRAAAAKLEEVALFGRNYEGQEAVTAGLVHEVAAGEEFESRCRARLEELAQKDARAFGISKGYLRQPVVERILAHDSRLVPEFLDAWFSSGTRERLTKIVADLEGRE